MTSEGIVNQVIDKDKAMFADKASPICIDEDALFAPSPAKKPSRVAAIGIVHNGELCAQATPEIAQVTELDMMEMDLLAVRLGLRPSVQTLTPAQLEAIAREPIGMACQWDGVRVADYGI